MWLKWIIFFILFQIIETFRKLLLINSFSVQTFKWIFVHFSFHYSFRICRCFRLKRTNFFKLLLLFVYFLLSSFSLDTSSITEQTLNYLFPWAISLNRRFVNRSWNLVYFWLERWLISLTTFQSAFVLAL